MLPLVLALVRRCLAISKDAAVSCASLGLCKCSGGTTTMGPMFMSSRLTVAEERRRIVDLPSTGERCSFGAGMVLCDID